MNKKMLLVVGLLLTQVGCAYTYIDSGNCGVKTNLSGTDRGIAPKPLGVGRNWYNPLTESIHEFPVYEQNVVWSKAGHEGKGGDESFTISSKESAQISCDVGLTFQLKEERVPHLFGVLRKDIDYISHIWMRNHVREALSKAAENLETMQILGEGKSELLLSAKAQLNKELAEYGIEVKLLSFVNTPRPEAKIQQSIDLTVQSMQAAKQAENKIQQAKAEADQKVEAARGLAESTKIQALAQLEAAASQAKSNELLSKSLTPELVRVKMIEKWDGTLPRFTGDSTPLIQFNDKTEVKGN